MKFVLEGKPIPQPRPRMTTGQGKGQVRVYDPSKVEKNECRKEIMSQMLAQGFLRRLEGPIAIKMVFHMKKAKKGIAGQPVGSPCATKPDIDNLAKFYLDVINDLLIVDDRMIAELWCKKIYSDKPNVEIWLKEIPKCPKET